jgi:hypothetical protein
MPTLALLSHTACSDVVRTPGRTADAQACCRMIHCGSRFCIAVVLAIGRMFVSEEQDYAKEHSS